MFEWVGNLKFYFISFFSLFLLSILNWHFMEQPELVLLNIVPTRKWKFISKFLMTFPSTIINSMRIFPASVILVFINKRGLNVVVKYFFSECVKINFKGRADDDCQFIISSFFITSSQTPEHKFASMPELWNAELLSFFLIHPSSSLRARHLRFSQRNNFH